MKHQTQPTHDSCVVTCLAMLVHRPVKVIYDHFHDKLWSHVMDTGKILRALDIEHRENFYEGPHAYKGKVYLIAVPSLQLEGSFHQVLLDCRGEELLVLDPARGLPDTRYYAWQPEKGEDPLAVPLVAWLSEYEVVPHEQCQGD